MKIARIDHLVLTVENIERTIAFYTGVLSMQAVTITRGENTMQALKFGNQRINLHQRGSERKPNAKNSIPGSQDICLITEASMNDIIDQLKQKDVPIELGPIKVPGAVGEMESVFIRDPDGNLLEISVPSM
jgi:catechol 2,3-dioxygenase-like lactoylglutathione lyase family enzyme